MNKLLKRIIISPYLLPVGTLYFPIYIIGWVLTGKTDFYLLDKGAELFVEPLTEWCDK